MGDVLRRGPLGRRIALLSKSHHVLVDGVETVDLGQVLLDVNPERKVLGGDEWRPQRPASTSSLVLEAVRDSVPTRDRFIDTVRSRTGAVLRGAEATVGSTGRVAP